MSPSQSLAAPVLPFEAAAANGPKPSLAAEVRERRGTDLNRGYQCRSCGNGCPFLAAMDYTPNQVLRLVQFGRREEVLTGKTIWVCVGCHTCSSQYLMGIDIAAA